MKKLEKLKKLESLVYEIINTPRPIAVINGNIKTTVWWTKEQIYLSIKKNFNQDNINDINKCLINLINKRLITIKNDKEYRILTPHEIVYNNILFNKRKKG